MRDGFFPAFLWMASVVAGNAVQLPPRLEQCLPIPTLAEEIRQRNTNTESSEHAQEPQKQIKLEELTFSGTTGLAPEELREITSSLIDRPYEDDTGWLAELSGRVRDAWQHRGYFRAQVVEAKAVERAGTPSEKRFAVKVLIDAGQRYGLKQISFRANSQFSQAELRAMFAVTDSDILDTYQLQAGIENLRKAYAAKGFINFSVVPSFDLDEEHAMIALDLEVEEGKQYRFAQIKVLGLDPQFAQGLLHKSGLETGRVFDPLLVGKFLEQNRAILPEDADAVEDVHRWVDESKGTVDITMDFRRCPNISHGFFTPFRGVALR